jgi:hypothetical protein
VLTVLAAASVLVAAPLAAPTGPAVAAPEPGIVVLNVTGSGCRPQTTAAALSLDRTAVTIIYSDYIVPAAGSTRTVSKNCRINLRIDPVPGYAPTITSVDYRGFADVAAGSAVQLAATYGFHGATHLESAAMRLAGPFSDNWQATDAAQDGLVTGKCRGSSVLDVDSTLSVTSTSAAAATDYIAMDSTDGVVPNTFHLTWTPCP